MAKLVSTPWHRASFDRFLNERLPALLAERLPLTGYQVTTLDAYTCQLTVTLASGNGDVEIVFENIPQPDGDGLFMIDRVPHVILPVANHQDLGQADIHCVGEQLFAYVEARLGEAPPDLPWNAELARAWLPLDAWVASFMAGDNPVARFTSTRLDDTNWLARHTHLRRLIIPDADEVITPSQLGRVCPFETPEGFRIGRVLTVAMGAEIRDGKLVVINERPEAKLGLSTSMIPFLEHDDPNRILMGANMMRQWVPQAQPEPALVQTGHEPDTVPFWHGRNLLTAFIAWGPGTYEDGIVVSETCAQRFDTPYPLRVGDKVANRHGTKGVVAQILPDDAMPHLPDGTPVDLVYNFANLHRRMNFGQLREAVAGRIARWAGTPVIAPPFRAPDEDELLAHLGEVGLPESGMEILTMGREGVTLDQPSTVGWVYWGRLFHLAKEKLHVFADGRWGQVQGEMENFMLRDLGALEIIRENLNTRSVCRPDAKSLPDRVAAGSVSQAAAPTPLFRELCRRLQVAGIEVQLSDDTLSVRFVPPRHEHLKLARPVPHPWLRERRLTEIGRPYPQAEGTLAEAYAAVIDANDRLTRLGDGETPQRLIDEAVNRLEDRVRVCFDHLLTPAQLRLSERVAFSGRAVLTPGGGLALDQVGLPEMMAWALFKPWIVRALDGDEEAMTARNARATQALDDVMARTWVIVNRAPTLAPTALLAFHPVRVAGDAIQIHPLVCEWLNADFDGDQAAVLLPITDAGQREAGETLSVAAHLRRDLDLLASLLPRQDALWGLAVLSRQPGGLDEVADLVGAEVDAPRGFVTRMTLSDALRDVLDRDGVEAVLARLERLLARGFEVAKASGASLAPFPAIDPLLSPAPPTEAMDAWVPYAAEVTEAVAAPVDCGPTGLAPQCLMVRASGRAEKGLALLIAGRGVVEDVEGAAIVVEHGYVDGYTPMELFAVVPGARRGLAQICLKWERMGRTFRQRNVSPSFHILTRALRAQYPGVVFARAAAIGESDPLTDVEARLLVGLPVP